MYFQVFPCSKMPVQPELCRDPTVELTALSDPRLTFTIGFWPRCSVLRTSVFPQF